MSISGGLISTAVSPVSDLAFSNRSALNTTSKPRTSFENESLEFNGASYDPPLVAPGDYAPPSDQLSEESNVLSDSVLETPQDLNESPLSFAISSDTRSGGSIKTHASPTQVLDPIPSSNKSKSTSIPDSYSSASSRISSSGYSSTRSNLRSDLHTPDHKNLDSPSVRTLSSRDGLLFLDEPASIANNPIVSMFNRLIDNPESPYSFAALLVGMVAIPSTVDRGLRSILNSGVARPLLPQHRNNALEAEWPLRLTGSKGDHLDLLVRLSKGQLSLSPLVSDSPSSSDTPHIRDLPSVPSFDSELWQLLNVQENPGEFLSDIRIYLDQLLSRSLEEADIPWIEWYDSKLRTCSKLLDFNTHDNFMHFRRDLLAAAAVDPSFADSMMLMQILDCNFKMGMKLPRVRT